MSKREVYDKITFSERRGLFKGYLCWLMWRPGAKGGPRHWLNPLITLRGLRWEARDTPTPPPKWITHMWHVPRQFASFSRLLERTVNQCVPEPCPVTPIITTSGATWLERDATRSLAVPSGLPARKTSQWWTLSAERKKKREMEGTCRGRGKRSRTQAQGTEGDRGRDARNWWGLGYLGYHTTGEKISASNDAADSCREVLGKDFEVEKKHWILREKKGVWPTRNGSTLQFVLYKRCDIMNLFGVILFMSFSGWVLLLSDYIFTDYLQTADCFRV